MKRLFLSSICSISFLIVGCADESSPAAAIDQEGDLTASLGANEVMTCGPKAALVGGEDGKATLVRLKAAGSQGLYALSGEAGALASLKTTVESEGTPCTKATGTDAASWATAGHLVSYASQIEDLAYVVAEEMASFENNSGNSSGSSRIPSHTYTIYAVETAKRDPLDLGAKIAQTAGALATEDDTDGLDENEWSYGGMSACYSLGGGEEYGEWFQAASDGISLSYAILPALNGARAGYIARERVKVLEGLADSTHAVEVTVGGLTFFLPDGFGHR